MPPVTPRGFRDVLPAEAAAREAVATRVAARFAAWGYVPVETPIVELVETLAPGGDLAGTAFRFFDSDGRLLALRPDMTLPLARMVTSRMKDEKGPLRLRYAGPVFREHVSLRGQAREFTQMGVEFVGESGPAADAEVVALMVESLVSAGLDEFSVVIGTVAVLRALIDEAGMDEAWGDEVLASVHERNLVELGRLSRIDGVVPAVRNALPLLVRIRGGSEAIEECRGLVAGIGCDEALDDLAATWSLLEVVGADRFVQIDFSVMRSFDYYTGMVLEAYMPGLGVSLGGGGRYDGVLAAYGETAPAAGFALGLERVMIALVSQGADVEPTTIEVVMGGEDPAAVFAAASELRDLEVSVVFCRGDRDEVARRADELGARPMYVEGTLGEVE